MAGCPPAAKLAVLGDLIIPIVLAAFLCNRDVITLVIYRVRVTHLGHHNDVSEQKHGQLVALPTQCILCCHLDGVRSTHKTEEEKMNPIKNVFLTNLLWEETTLAGQFSISE